MNIVIFFPLFLSAEMGLRSRRQSKAIKRVSITLFSNLPFYLTLIFIKKKKKKKTHGRSGLSPQSPRSLLYFQRQSLKTMKDSV